MSKQEVMRRRVREWAHGRRREWDRAARRTRLLEPPARRRASAGGCGGQARARYAELADAAWAAYGQGDWHAGAVLLMQAVAERRAWLELTAWGRRGRAFGSLTPASRSWLVGR